MLPLLVGIGASAGGLDALRHFINGLPPGLPAAIVIAQHLSPTHTSLLTELLARDTRFKVIEAEDGAALQPACLYVTPPSCDVEVQGESLRLLTPENATGAKPSINRLFSSMATNAQARMRVGVVLSGTGSDGALGMAELRRAGGITVVQSLETCAYDGMPRAAMESGAADLMLEPGQIGPWLARQLDGDVKPLQRQGDPLPDELVHFVMEAAGLDLSGYKTGTLRRRLTRRMALRAVPDQDSYVKLIQNDPNELRAFVQDVFISVTEFFRDPPAIARLREELSVRLMQFRDPAPFRVWVPGCASGEEAYTVAILIEECLREHGRALDYRLFCTDIAQRPLDLGRVGSYDAAALSAMPTELRDRYFEAEGDGRRYRITRRVRDRLVFSVHDVTADAPFSRLDFVSCRNMLIYFSSALQQQVLQHLHYALKPGGLLFLGAAESISASRLGFSVVDDAHRLFRREGSGLSRPPLVVAGRARRRPMPAQPMERADEPLDEVAPRLYRLATERLSTIAVVVNDRDELMFSAGATNTLFQARSGEATLDLVDMSDEHIGPLLRSLLFRARRSVLENPPAVLTSRMGLDGAWLAQAGQFDPRRGGWLLLTFQHQIGAASGTITAPAPDDEAQLKQELEATRAYLQQVIEDFEATNEQLQAANEELQSANEEFHSTNEELQTTVEELRSTNEELHTVNDELTDKTRALAQSSSDLRQALGSLRDTALMVVDEQFRLRLFNAAVSRLARINEVVEGESLFTLPWHGDIAGLRDCVQRVIQRGVTDVRPVELGSDSYQMSVTPYRDDHGAIRGAVLVFTDVSDLARSQSQLAAQETQLRMTLAALREGVLRVDRDGQLLYANAKAQHLFGLVDLRGVTLASLKVTHEGQQYSLHQLLAPYLLSARGGEQGLTELRVGLPQSELLLDVSMGATILDGTVLVFHEVTERVRYEQHLDHLSTHDHLTSLVNRRGFERLLASACAARQPGAPLCVAFLDLDQFKLVNDVSGHHAGDALLQRIADLLASGLRPDDRLGRIGGDEFALTLPRTELAAARRIVERLVQMVAAFRFSAGEHQHAVGLSCGIAAVAGDDTTGLIALVAAGQAASVAKRYGGGRVETADADNPRIRERQLDQQWLLRLRDDRSELLRLVPRFEPLQALGSAGFQRWELLLRYENEDGSLSPPAAFVPAAERNGFIHRVDLRALDCALAVLLNAPEHVRLHVNVSPASLAKEYFLDHVVERLTAHPNLANRLCFEITETAAYQILDRVHTLIARVRDFGAEVFLDDFGAGSSTLANLRVLPVQGLKIDGQLVRRIRDDRADWITLEAIHRIADHMGLVTVAEFAETPELLEALRELNIDYAQGWAVGREVTPEVFRSHFGEPE